MREILTKSELDLITEQVEAIDLEISWLDTSRSYENDRLSTLLTKLDEYEAILNRSIKSKRRRSSGLRIVA